MSGIYQYVNKINGHIYIGLSKNIERRIKEHKKSAFNPNDKDYNLPIHRAIRKYGENNFDINILEECADEELQDREKYWIKYYNSYELQEHYNLTPGGEISGENNIHRGEEHGNAKLTESQVKMCRLFYSQGKRSKDIYNKYFKDIINWGGFERMWHGKTWKHVMPEVFNTNPHPGKYTLEDCEYINKMFKESNLSLKQFSQSPECFVGYGTLWKMINTPEFYQ